MAISSGDKPARLNIRVSEFEKQVITQAAGRLNTTVSSFVLQRAFAEAQSVLADQSQFRLPDEQWVEFCNALDAPPKKIATLRELLLKPGVFDE